MKKKKSGFLANVVKLVGGSAVAQGLGIAVMPVLTRLFAPEAFGIAALFTSVTAIVGVVACMRYELAIMLPESDEEAANLLGVSIAFVILVTVISGVVFILLADPISVLLNSPEFAGYLWLVPIAVFVSGMFLALNYWNSRTKNFGRLAAVRVVASGANQGLRLLAGFTRYTTAGALIGASIIGNMLATVILGTRIWREDGSIFRASIRTQAMIEGLKRHKKFPLYSSWSALLNMVSRQLPPWMLAIYFSPQIVGFFAIGRLVLSTPMRLVGSAVAQVFFQRASEAKSRTQDLDKVVGTVLTSLIAIGLFPILLLTIIGREIFMVVFGAQWADAGVYTQILAIWIFFQFISSPISTLSSVLEKQDSMLIFNIILLVTRVLALVIGGWTGNILLTLLLFALSGVVCYGAVCLWLASLAGFKPGKIFAAIARYALYGAPFLLVSAAVKWPLMLSEIWVCIVGVVAFMGYYSLVIWRDKDLRAKLFMLIKKR